MFIESERELHAFFGMPPEYLSKAHLLFDAERDM
jgi:hypothetical protein